MRYNKGKFDLEKFKRDNGLYTIPSINPPEDYSTIQDDKWYYVQGDGGMLGKEVKERHITMSRVTPWYEYKRRQREFNEEQKRIKEQYEREHPMPF